MAQPSPTKDEIHFHPEQIKYLEKLFPDTVMSPAKTEAELRYYHGQRSVVKLIASKVK